MNRCVPAATVSTVEVILSSPKKGQKEEKSYLERPGFGKVRQSPAGCATLVVWCYSGQHTQSCHRIWSVPAERATAVLGMAEASRASYGCQTLQ